MPAGLCPDTAHQEQLSILDTSHLGDSSLRQAESFTVLPSEGEGEDITVRNYDINLLPSPASEGQGAVRVSESVITTAPSGGGANTSMRNDQSRAVDTRRDFDRRRFWRQLSTTTEDLDSIEPR